jgi:hypothetical protein
MAGTSIAIVNDCTVLDDATIAQAVAALQIQVARDFAPAWGMGANLVFVPRGQSPAAGAWQLAVLDHSDQAGALGYHETTADGQPLGKAFVADDMDDGLAWAVTISHELLEMLGDPEADQTVPGPDGRMYAREVCDPCEDDQFGYLINGVRVSDFVLPAYYSGGNGPFDFTAALATGLPGLATGGYLSSYDPADPSAGWTQVYGEHSARDRGRLPRGFFRRKLRGVPREARRRSTRWG